MKENILLDNIYKLNTYVHMSKSNELLKSYVEKIMNNRSKSVKFESDFDTLALDLLYTSLQLMTNKNKLSNIEFRKLDSKEIAYYMKKVKGINYFKKQVPSIKNEEILINYIINALAKGLYICNYNNTIKFDNGLVIDANWVEEFSVFLVTSLNNNINLSNDSLTYYFNTVSIPKYEGEEVSKYIKNIKQYEYSCKRKDGKRLNSQDVKFMIDTLSVIEDYDFKQLQEINSILDSDKYSLSVNKKTVNFTKEDKIKIEKYLNEEMNEEILNEFIKDTLNCYNSKTNKNRRNLVDTYSMLKSLAYAYKSNYDILIVRKIIGDKEWKQSIVNAITIAEFYINYIYDEDNMNKHFNYEVLALDDLKPSIIDYETPEYKAIIKRLSFLNKKVVAVNRRINRYLDESRNNTQDSTRFIEENSQGFSRNCELLDKYVKEIKELRMKLDEAKDVNRLEANINKTKLRYIKDSIISGEYTYLDNNIIEFNVYSNEDFHQNFHLEISLDDFNNIILSEDNCRARINFYQI